MERDGQSLAFEITKPGFCFFEVGGIAGGYTSLFWKTTFYGLEKR
jgi:hypothetical protein